MASSPPLAFSILLAISLVLWWAPLTFTLALASRDDRYTHILLILPISAALIFIERKSIWQSRETLPRPSAILASGFLIAAILVNILLRETTILSPDIRLAANMLALVGWWIAAFLLCFGARAWWRALFPLGFLLWMVPFPEFALNFIVSELQKGSASAAHLLFAAVGIPVTQTGLAVHIPGLTLLVAPECSSIRSSLMLVVATMVLAHLLLHSTWRKVLLVAVAIPLSVAKNGLRIFTLGALATRVDRSFLHGWLHHDGGVVFLAIALAATFLLLWILRHGEKLRFEAGTVRVPLVPLSR